jgi:hypothetical protein
MKMTSMARPVCGARSRRGIRRTRSWGDTLEHVLDAFFYVTGVGLVAPTVVQENEIVVLVRATHERKQPDRFPLFAAAAAL